MVVVVIFLPVVIKPGLHTFGEVLVVVNAGVFAFPQTLLHRGIISCLDPAIEGWVDIDHSPQMNIVRQFVNENILCRIRVPGIAQQILFATRTKGIGLASTHPPGAGVVVIVRGDPWESGYRPES